MSANPKNIVEVVIAGNIIPLAGFESEEYIRELAAYVDKKIAVMGNTYLNTFLQNIFIAINIADDYFKQKMLNDSFSNDKENEINSLKLRVEECLKEIETLCEENILLKNRITTMQLEMEMSSHNTNRNKKN
jgi:cell division protein ZapA